MPFVKRLWAVVEPVSRATVHFHRDGCFDRATVIAYFGLLSFLPRAVFLVTIGAFALGTDAAEKGTELFFQNLLYRMPPQLMTQVRSLQSDVWSGVGYIVLVLWTASKVFSKVGSGLDHIFPCRQAAAVRPAQVVRDRSRRLDERGPGSDGGVGGRDGHRRPFHRYHCPRAAENTAALPGVGHVRQSYGYPVVAHGVHVFVVYWLVPAKSIPWRVALVGGVVAGTLWNVLKIGFTYYISHLASYTRTYGALATLIVFLLWINLSASILLWGGELAAVAGGFRNRDND